MIGNRVPTPTEAEACRLMTAALIAFLRNDETSAEDANLIGAELAALDMSGDDLFGALLQTSAAIVDLICTSTRVDSIATLQRFMALVQSSDA